MADDKEKKDDGVTVRIPQWILDQIEARLSKMPRPRPNRGDLLTEAWEAFVNPKKEPTSPHVAKLERILDSNDELAINAVTLNIDLFYERLRPQPKPPARRRTGT